MYFHNNIDNGRVDCGFGNGLVFKTIDINCSQYYLLYGHKLYVTQGNYNLDFNTTYCNFNKSGSRGIPLLNN